MSELALPAAPALAVHERSQILHYNLAERHDIEFSADAGEYFRIWIVNTVLSLLTLGIYSAWAKVRTQRYFYAHTRIDGAAFDYLAQPLPILKGRLIAATLFGAYLLTAQFAPTWNLAVVLLIAALTPWIIVRGLKFRARYSAWRGIHFRFVGSNGGSYAVFLGLMLLVPFTLGLLYPYVKARQQQYVVEHHRYGNRPFAFVPQFPMYFLLYLGTGAALVAGILALSGAIGAAAFAGGGRSAQTLVFVMIGAAYLLYFGAFVFLRAKITNLLWNNSTLDGIRFESRLAPATLAWIYLGNAVAILASIGLLIPWAMVRTARYRASCLSLVSGQTLDAFVADCRADETAVGAEIGDAFDVDIGL
jgi:uncharacterized membrane protein YjgN (DUF898 family)